MEKYVIITAGGRGERMGAKLPKQFLEIEGKPILRYTLEAFLVLPYKVNILLVLGEDMKSYWKEYCINNDFNVRHRLVSGGFTRFHSVKNALAIIPEGCVVAVHDGVRPILSTEFLESVYVAGEELAAVIPTIGLTDSIREVSDDGSSFSVDRSNYRLVQTPQIFHSTILKQAYDQPYNTRFTDDASVVEAYGQRIFEVEGCKSNIKITTPEDLSYAKILLQDVKMKEEGKN